MNDDTTLTQTAQSETPLRRAQTALDALRTLRSLDGATPTNEQRDSLLRWHGWGALAPAFDEVSSPGWSAIADDIDQLVSTKALDVARDHIDTSFYTPAAIVDAAFDLLRSVGFTEGRVLEPGCGSGRFMAATPADLDIDWTGVDIDPTAIAMARALNPAAKLIAAPLQRVSFATGEFDAAIGNVPFAHGAVHDPNFGYHSSLHGYFLARALDAVREGGYVIAITSRFVMDSDSGLRSILTDTEGNNIAQLVGAVRLPAGTFASEGTDVVTDIVLIRKIVRDAPVTTWDDDRENAPTRSIHYPYTVTSTRPTVTTPVTPGQPGIPTSVNAYWATHPEHVAGTMKVGTFHRNPLTVISDDRPADIARALDAIRPHLIPQADRPHFDPATELADVALHDAEGRKEGSFHVVDGTLHEVTGGTLSEIRNNAELRQLVTLRDLAVRLLELESDADLPDDAITAARAATLEAYTAYVAKFGPLNRGTLTEGKPDPDTGEPLLSWRRPAMGGFRRDPDYVSVMAIETFDQDEGIAAPAPILLRRVNRKPEPATTAETPDEALSISVGEGRGVDLARIAGLLSLPTEDDAVAALGNLVFDVDGHYVDAHTYLSGNIRTKLAYARARALDDSDWAKNVAALEEVMPADLGPLDIRVSLGAPFVAAADIDAFIKEVLGGHAGVTYTADAAVWEINGGAKGQGVSADARLAYGTTSISPIEILEHALNGRSIVIYDEVWSSSRGTTVRVRNVEASIAAEEKSRAMSERFSTWVWENADRSERICATYNRRFNSHVTRTFDGSRIEFPGLAESVTPWGHQRNAVARVTASERALIGHPVGSGKTLTMILSAMTLRRFGLANKPLITVPNHLLEQIVREAQQAFPTGRFLIASKEDLTGDRRRLFAARCATGEWDAVVMTHTAFTSLPVSEHAEEAWVERQKSDLRGGMLSASNGYGSSKGAKAIARAVRGLDTRLGVLRQNKQRDDNQVLFDHLGVDYVMVDEAHLFRRLATGSTARGNGFGSGSSKRATDMLLKIETLAQKYPGKPIVSMFTGTPWANTLAETWTWQRYLQPDALEAAGVKMFDPWVASFINYETAVEVAPDGSGFRMNTRPVGVKNLPELLTLLGQVAEVLDANSLGLVRPTHTLHTVVAKPTDAQLDYVKDLAERADSIRSGGKADNGKAENMLQIVGDGRKVALDPILVGLDDVSPKLVEAADRIADVHHTHTSTTYGDAPTPGALQLAMLDLGTPHPDDAQVYGRLRNMLVQRGIPARSIRFIHEAKTDKARAAMFSQARDGGISVLLGSTSKLGIGTNVQTRLVALHHIDAPWTAAEVEQREGRILRPKNLNTHVDIFRYVTESSFDAFTWQTLERKARSFAKLLAFDTSVREIEDVAPSVLSYGEVKALAAGNPLLLDQAKLAAEVGKLRLMRAVHLQGVNQARSTATNCRALISGAERTIELLEEAKRIAAEADGDDTAAVQRVSTELLKKAKDAYAYAGRIATWRGLTLGRPYREVKGQTVLEVSVNYRSAHSFEVPRAIRRAGAESVAEFITDKLEEWVEGIDRRIRGIRRDIARYEAEAAEATAAADTARFDRQDELDSALAELARIDTLIDAEASRDELAKVA